MRFLLLALVGACLPSCGGGPSTITPVPSAIPATPTPVPPAVARDGLTHEVVSAEINPARPRTGEGVTARAPEFLVREQMFDGATLFLWPGYQGHDQEYVNELVYHARFTDGSYGIIRWTNGFTVTLDGLAENPGVMDRTQEVVAEMVAPDRASDHGRSGRCVPGDPGSLCAGSGRGGHGHLVVPGPEDRRRHGPVRERQGARRRRASELHEYPSPRDGTRPGPRPLAGQARGDGRGRESGSHGERIPAGRGHEPAHDVRPSDRRKPLSGSRRCVRRSVGPRHDAGHRRDRGLSSPRSTRT